MDLENILALRLSLAFSTHSGSLLSQAPFSTHVGRFPLPGVICRFLFLPKDCEPNLLPYLPSRLAPFFPNQPLRGDVRALCQKERGNVVYARKGAPMHEIGTLERWKPSAVFCYIEEALQDIPLNANAFGSNQVIPRTRGQIEFNPGAPGLAAMQDMGQSIVEAKTHDVQVSKQKKQPALPDQCWAVSSGRNGKVSHRARKASWNLSLGNWGTWCGCHFAEKNIKMMLTPKFHMGTSKCKKCESAHQSRDRVKGGVSLAQLVSLDDTDQKATA